MILYFIVDIFLAIFIKSNNFYDILSTINHILCRDYHCWSMFVIW